jgi:hypothetical protein
MLRVVNAGTFFVSGNDLVLLSTPPNWLLSRPRCSRRAAMGAAGELGIGTLGLENDVLTLVGRAVFGAGGLRFGDVIGITVQAQALLSRKRRCPDFVRCFEKAHTVTPVLKSDDSNHHENH